MFSPCFVWPFCSYSLCFGHACYENTHTFNHSFQQSKNIIS
jgi:hypothetical protein